MTLWPFGDGHGFFMIPLLCVLGILMLFGTLHLARGIGKFHGWLAKHLLVRDPVV